MINFRSRYLYLLASFLLYFIASPFLIANQLNDTFVSLFISLVIVLCVNVITRNRILLTLSIILGAVSIVSYWTIYLSRADELWHIIYIVSVLLFLLVMTYFVISSITQSKEITQDTLMGAISGYILLGLTWAVIYLLIEHLDSSAIQLHRLSISNRDHIQQIIYYSFETLTTLGYGDILPISDVARSFAWLEAVTGQIYLAVWISQLVGLRIAQMMRGSVMGMVHQAAKTKESDVNIDK